jgi:hypothetical protein
VIGTNRLATYKKCLDLMKLLAILGLQELPLQGNKFTWSNKYVSPLLEHLDCFFFASISWITSYTRSVVSTLSYDVSNYHLSLVYMSPDIPKAKIFRFENFSLSVMQHGWSLAVLPQIKPRCQWQNFKT